MDFASFVPSACGDTSLATACGPGRTLVPSDHCDRRGHGEAHGGTRLQPYADITRRRRLHHGDVGRPIRLSDRADALRLSQDSLGQYLRMQAASNGVDVTASPEADEPTMIAVVATDADDSADGLYFRDTASWQWSAAELGWIPADTSVLNLDVLDCCVLPGSTWILRTAARQRYRGAIVCLNVTVKPAVMGSPARGRSLLDRPVKAADLVITSLKDISWLYPGRGAEAVARLWLAQGPELVVITCGPDGLGRRQEVRERPLPGNGPAGRRGDRIRRGVYRCPAGRAA